MLLDPSEGDLTQQDVMALQNGLIKLRNNGHWLENTGGIKIRVTKSTAAPDPSLPSQFFPGCGSDRFTFQIITWHRPAYEVMNRLIDNLMTDYMMMDYDAIQGSGRVVCVDTVGPDLGAIFMLVEPHNWTSLQEYREDDFAEDPYEDRRYNDYQD
ncbi:hypothetical protein RYA05_01365 [Pseudomonas syringae pv. actinidiae]|nr:hypothetical protein [Pseudomonas syringae pv. actinidiae]